MICTLRECTIHKVREYFSIYSLLKSPLLDYRMVECLILLLFASLRSMKLELYHHLGYNPMYQKSSTAFGDGGLSAKSYC